MNVEQIFESLGQHLTDLSLHSESNLILQAKAENQWFTTNNTTRALKNWGNTLVAENISNWLNKYQLPNLSPKRVGIIMAGNIPLVGLHDLLCVIASGHVAVCKLSTSDKVLMTAIIDFLRNKGLAHQIILVENMKEIDAVIATGSNNTSRYFEYYFGKYPHIIRKNRSSIAVLNGDETFEQLELLGDDVFSFFGLGCRNVSKVLVPTGYNFNKLFEAFFKYGDVINHHKYANNYDYNKAIYLLSKEPFLDNNFMLLRQDNVQISSPLGVLFYQKYENEKWLGEFLEQNNNEIQVVIGANVNFPRTAGFGEAQKPSLLDYADGIDVMQFLGSMKF